MQSIFETMYGRVVGRSIYSALKSFVSEAVVFVSEAVVSFSYRPTAPLCMSGSAYNNHENPEDSRCSAMDCKPARLKYISRSLQLRQPVLCALRIVVSFVTMGSFTCICY